MGKLLQIRVSAWTYREEDVVRAWPALTALAWPRPQYPDEKRGVLELVTALENGLSFEDWPQAVAEGLREGIGRAAAVKKQAESDIAQEKKKAVNELKGEISDISMTIAEQVVGREVTPADHHAMIDAFIAGMDSGDSHA